MDLWIVRHGETAWSRSGRHTGRTDLELTESGLAAVSRLGEALRRERFDVVLSSPLQRARATAEAIGLDFEIDERLAEIDYGEYEGLTTVQIRSTRANWDLWHDGSPGGESVAEVGQRVDGVLDRLIDGGVRRGLIVAHGHTLRILAARYLGLDASMGRLFKLDTGTVSVLGVYHDRPVIERWNAAVPPSPRLVSPASHSGQK